MTIKQYIVTLLVLTILGCNSDKKRDKVPIETSVNTQYQGEIQPCKDYYDPLWCKDRSVLNSDTNISIQRDKNGSPIILNPDLNSTKDR